MRTHYDILAVAVDASSDQIKNSYRQLALKYHPDKHPNDKNAEEQFKLINEAYRVLSNNELRTRYNEELKSQEVDVFDIIEEQTASSINNNLMSDSLAVRTSYKLQEIIKQANLNDTAVFRAALHDPNLAKALFDSSEESSRACWYYKDNEELVIEAIKKNKLRNFDILLFSRKFSSACQLALQNRDFLEWISSKDAFDLASQYQDDQSVQSLVKSNNSFLSKVKKYEQEEKIKFEVALKSDNKNNRKIIAEWIDTNRINIKYLTKLAKNHLMVAHVILDYDFVRKLFTFQEKYLLKIVLAHEEIALRLLNIKKYRTFLKERFYYNSKIRSLLYFISENFSSVRGALLQNAYWQKYLPITELIDLYQHKKVSLVIAERIEKYSELQALLVNESKRIESLIEESNLTKSELVDLAKSSDCIAQFILESEEYKETLGFWLEYIAKENEKFAIELVCDEKNEPFIRSFIYKENHLFQWKSVCLLVLDNPVLTKELRGDVLLNMENRFGIEVSEKISAAGLQRRLFAAALFDKARHQEGGFDIKRSTRYAYIQDEAEMLYRRALQPDVKLELSFYYLQRSASMKHKPALTELVARAKDKTNPSDVFPAIELCWLQGEEQAANKLSELIKKIVSVGQVEIFLNQIQVRLDSLKDQASLVTIGNEYFEIIDSLIAREDLNASGEQNTILRYLSSFFEENDPAIALSYLNKMSVYTVTDLLNLSAFSSRIVEDAQRAEIIENYPEATSEEFRQLMSKPANIFARYQALLPFYLQAVALGDEDVLSVVTKMLDELSSLDIDKIEKQRALLLLGWQERTTNLAWQKAALLGDPIASYMLTNTQGWQSNTFLREVLKLVSTQYLVEALPLLDRLLKLSTPNKKIIQSNFIELLSNEIVTVARLAEMEVALTKLELIEKQAIENAAAYSKFKTYIASCFESKLSDLRNEARQYRSMEDHDAAASFGIKADLIEGVAVKLTGKLNEFYSEKIKLGETPFAVDQLKKEMIKIINDNIREINPDLQAHAGWRIQFAYTVVKVLQNKYPRSAFFADWMAYNIEENFRVLPDIEQRSIIKGIRAIAYSSS